MIKLRAQRRSFVLRLTPNSLSQEALNSLEHPTAHFELLRYSLISIDLQRSNSDYIHHIDPVMGGILLNQKNI